MNVRRGSGSSRKNFLRRAASWTALSCVRSTDEGSRSIASVSSLRRLIFPFFRNIPSTDISIPRKCVSSQTRGRNRRNCSIPICRMADTTSSMKLGTLSGVLHAPYKESAPSRSTNNSRGTPNTPSVKKRSASPKHGCDVTGVPFFFTSFFPDPPALKSLFQKPPFFISNRSKISSISI